MRNYDARMPWTLVAIGVGLFLLAHLSWSSPPGWIAAGVLIVMSVIGRIRARIRKHDADNAKRNAQRIDLTKR